MKRGREAALLAWSRKQKVGDLRKLVVELIEECDPTGETVSVGDAGTPYWSNTGEPLVDGQTIWSDEE